MIGIAGRWMTATWRRGVVCLLVAMLLCSICTVAWREFCLWRVESCLVIRQDRSANLWLGRSFPSILPDARIFLIRCKLARRSGNLKETDDLLTEAEKRGASVKELKRERALVRAQTLRFDSFIKEDWARLFEDPRDDEPEIAKAYVTWANSRFQFDEAAVILNVWQRDYPTDPDPHFLRGQIHAGMSNWKSAEASFRDALRLSPNRADIQAALASSLKEQFQFEEAIHWYRESLRNRPKSSEVIFELSQSLLTYGDLAAAKQTVEDGLKDHPDDLDLQQMVGEILLSEGNAHEAINHLKQVSVARPENSSLAYRLASALQADGRPNEAKPLLAFVEESRGPLAQLKPLNEEMIKHPDDVEVRFQIATITAKYNSRVIAIRWFQNLLRIDPAHRPSHLALAEIYQSMGDDQRAQQHLQIAQSLGDS